jgi:hypothetical protein
VEVLGAPDNATGIYNPGGYSIGYGNEEPTVENYGRIFWLHFQPEDWMDEALKPHLLVGWGDPI